jgi:hypothetical protein
VADHDPSELDALRSPLSVADAVARLGQLGATARLPTPHRGLIALEIAPSADPIAALLDVQIEDRHAGCYVTARVASSAFLRDFARVVRGVLSVYALGIALFALNQLHGQSLGYALLGVAGGWAALLAFIRVAVRMVAERGELELPRTRLRHRLAGLICR